ncbi:MAG: carboxypeptidase-like regulatory domain-containing protein [Planctomycetota bacterium]
MKRRLATIAVVLAAAILVAVGISLWRAPGEPETLLPAQPPLSAEVQRELAARMAARVDERPNFEAERRDAVAAAVPTEPAAVRVRIVDAGTGDPLAGAVVFDIVGRRQPQRAGADGIVTLAHAHGGTIAVVAEGYLAKLPTAGDADDAALAAAAGSDELVDIALRRDDFTLPCALRFLDQDGAEVDSGVAFTVACLDEPPPTAMSFPSARLASGARVDADIARAWQQNVAVQLLPGVAGPLLHLGVQSNGRVFEAPDGRAELRFVAAGRYRVLAVARAALLAGEAVVHVAAGGPGPFDVRLLPGRFVAGTAVDASDGRPVAGVTVRLAEPAASVLSETETDASGEFRLGPVASPSVSVVATSRRYRDVTAALAPGSQNRLTLTPRPVRLVRGVVRRRPAAAPIAGATVLLRQGFDVEVETKTGADGVFELSTVADVPELVVKATGSLTWVEVIRDVQESYPCDLWPSEAAARVQAGVSASVEGRVVGPDNQPRAGVPVQLLGDEAPVPEGLPGRVVCEGLLLPLLPLTTSRADGSFALEWGQAGTFRVLATDGVASIDDATPVTLTLGQSVRGLVLRASR